MRLLLDDLANILRPRTAVSVAAGLTSLLLFGSVASGDEVADGGSEHAVISGDLADLSDEELESRVASLVGRLDAGKGNAQLWQYSFQGAWGIGIALGTTEAVLTNDRDKRVSSIVTASKATLGSLRLGLWPNPGRLGAEPILEIPGDDRQALEARVRAGEAQLLAVDHRARSRKSWVPHASNVGINMAGFGVIAALGDLEDAAISAGVGIAFGELMLLTMPWRGEEDLAAYRRSLGNPAPVDPKPSFFLAPSHRGAVVGVRF